MIKILVLHGPNLNLLGTREKSMYGNTSLKELDLNLQKIASEAEFDLTSKQSNSEAELISAIHESATDKTAFIIFNPAAFSHTSIALRDALLAVEIPFIEVHISNIYARETFRQNSYFSDIAHGIIAGCGTNGYLLALQTIIDKFNRESSN